MAEPDRPQSPFAGMADFSVRTPVRALSPDEIERMLAEHRLYLETEYHQGHRANFSSADLTGRDFSGLNLRAIKMDRAVLQGADFTGAHLQGTSHVRRLEENAAAAALSFPPIQRRCSPVSSRRAPQRDCATQKATSRALGSERGLC